MKKLILAFLTFISFMSFAHTPFLSVKDEKNGYITITGGYTNGETGEGTPIIIVKDKLYNGSEEAFYDKMIIFQGVLDKNSELKLPKPKTSKYIIYFDGGDEAHITEKKGPKLTEEEMELWKKAIENSNEILGNYKDKYLDLVK